MSLTGNLEDLPLLDILQIVSFSKKTGWLGIRTSNGEGAIVFDDGFVVASFAPETPTLAPDQAALPPEERSKLVRRRMETALEQLIRLREGQFQFSLAEEPPRRLGERDLALETLSPGINPQELLLDLARGMDEDRRDSSVALEEGLSEATSETSFAGLGEDAKDRLQAGPEPPPAAAIAPEAAAWAMDAEQDSLGYTVPMKAVQSLRASTLRLDLPAEALEPADEPQASEPAQAETDVAGLEPGKPAPALLLVDDEEDVRQLVGQVFSHAGWQVVEAESPDAAVKKAQRLADSAIPFLVVCDLGMPTSGGASFHGGFEVVKRLGKMNLKPPVLLMTESLTSSVRARAKQMKIAKLVFKPSLSRLDPEEFQADMRDFARQLLEKQLPSLVEALSAEPPPGKARTPAPASAASSGDRGRDFRVLQQYLPELKNVLEPTRISALIMKVAREFFERAVLFLIRNEEVRGLGGFGPAGESEGANAVAREIVVPLHQPSVFLDVVSSARPHVGALPEGRWTEEVLGRLGRGRAGGAALVPLVAHRETIAILFGDNPETGRPLGSLDAFELYVSQAGTALENALLQKKLRALQEKS